MRCVVTRCRSRSWLRTRGRRQQQYGRFRLYGHYVSLWICINLLHDAKFYECKFAIWRAKVQQNNQLCKYLTIKIQYACINCVLAANNCQLQDTATVASGELPQARRRPKVLQNCSIPLSFGFWLVG